MLSSRCRGQSERQSEPAARPGLEVLQGHAQPHILGRLQACRHINRLDARLLGLRAHRRRADQQHDQQEQSSADHDETTGTRLRQACVIVLAKYVRTWIG